MSDLQNRDSRHITIAEMSPHVHSFEYGENKVNKISAWLITWIQNSLEKGNIKPYDFLPSKSEFAFHLSVSLGTMQSVFRVLEDYGVVESKQKIGTYIVSSENNDVKVQKLTSKREIVSEKIKQYILNKKLSIGEPLPSARYIAEIVNTSSSTVQSALSFLTVQGILEKKNNTYIIINTDISLHENAYKTLVEKIADKIRFLITDDEAGLNKLPSNPKLAKMFGVSTKTIHDSLKILIKEGLIITKRGRYGTIKVNEEKNKELYLYEKAEINIKHYILENCNVGSKLPSLREFSVKLQMSTKSVKNALNNMAQDGYLAFQRGRHGGTYVIDLPQPAKEAYTWLALSHNYIKGNNN